ncbi:MAG: F0F1 ATP synthase subunit epsilon [Dehalococcoidia bacterium]|nr:F0F1 ATP synthase subunit epsilon [Dehalococcoidia bacterium]
MATLHIEIITAERTVLIDDVDMVIAPGSEGQLGILPMHAPLLTVLGPGEIRLKKGAAEQSIAVTGGFLEVHDNHVAVLADAAERSDEIDEARAEEAMQRAQERMKLASTDVDLERASRAVHRAAVRVTIARKRRGGQGGTPGGRPPEA